MKKTEYISALRELADFLESKELPESWKSSWGSDEGYPSLNVSLFTYDKNTFGHFAGELGGFEKSASDSFLTCRKQLKFASVTVHADREKVCEKIKVGTKIIPAKEEEIIPAEEEREEDVYEWKCPDSFLELKNS